MNETAANDTEPAPGALALALRVLPGFASVQAADIGPLPGHGIAHAHFRVADTGALLRVPRLSQWNMAPADFLDYQAAAFRRAAPSRRVPALHGVLPVSDALPWGALVVEEISGAKPRLPGDMAAIAETLAAIHRLPLPPEEARAPLQIHDAPVAATLSVIEEQAHFLDEAPISDDAKAILREEIAALGGLLRGAENLPRVLTLVATDAHPGNYLMDRHGRAMFVDLEKMLYGLPAIDLAHASLYTSTRFDPDIDAELSPDETRAFYDAYYAAAPPALAEAVRPWAAPARRLTWLRTLTWCVRWTVLSERETGWAAGRLPASMRTHMAKTIARYLDPAALANRRETIAS